MINQQLVFRFSHDGDEYNIATSSFMFTESGDYKTAQGSIDGNKSLSSTKEMGLFLWGNRSEYQFSDIWILNESQSINNTAGQYDDLLDMLRDTEVELFVAEIDGKGESEYSDWVKVGEYLVDRVRNSGDNHIVISLLTKLVLMDRNTETQYFDSALVYAPNQNQPRPICLGLTYNAPGKLVDDTTNEWEFHDENTIGNVIYAYDDYDVFNEGVDFVEGAIAATGGYGINLSSPAAGKITALVNGGKYSGNTTNLINRMIPKLLIDYSGIDISDIDTTSVDDINTEWDGRCGVYISTPTNVRDIVENLNIAHCGYTKINSSGQISFDWLKEPTGTAAYEIDEYYIAEGVTIEPDGAPGLSDGVASNRNWHVFTDGDVAPSVAQDEKDLVTQAYQNYYRSSTTTGGGSAFDDYYAHARNGCYIGTLSSNASKTEDLITHLETIYATKKQLYTFDIIVHDLVTAMQMNIGDELKITWPRFGLDAGKNVIIKKIIYNDILNRRLKVTGWG